MENSTENITKTQKSLDNSINAHIYQLQAALSLSNYVDETIKFYKNQNVSKVVTYITVWATQPILYDGLTGSNAREIVLLGDIDRIPDNNVEGLLWRLNTVVEANIKRSEKGIKAIDFLNNSTVLSGFVYAEIEGKNEVLFRTPSSLNDSSQEFGYHFKGESGHLISSTLKPVLLSHESTAPTNAHAAFLRCLRNKISDDIRDKFSQKYIVNIKDAFEFLHEEVSRIFKLEISGKEKLKKFFDYCNTYYKIDLHRYIIDKFPLSKIPIMRTSFSEVDIIEAKKTRKLLRLAIEVDMHCNYKCVYCYAGNGRKRRIYF